MLHGKMCAGEETWAPEARLHRWKNDQLEDLHNDDALWGFMIQASEEYRLMDHTKLCDPVMRSLLRMGIYDWKGEDHCLHQTTPAMRHATTMATRLLARTMTLEDQVG